MLRDVTQRAVRGVLEENGIPYVFRKQENLLELTDFGSEMIFRSMDDPTHLVGTNLAWFGIDELTFCKEESFQRLQARLRHPRASELCGFGVWTPNGYDWVYERFISKGDTDYEAVMAQPGENKALPADFYEKLAASYDERFYQQEVLGKYLNIRSGRAYYSFDRSLNIKTLTYDSAQPICWSLDFNVNPMCSVIGQRIPVVEGIYEKKVSRFNVLEEIYIQDSNTPQACAEFVNRVAKYARGRQLLVNVYGDATGSKRTTATVGSPSDWSTVRQELARYSNLQVSYKYSRGNPIQKDRVAAVNAVLCNSQGERRCFIDPRCDKLVRDLERVTWKQGAAILDQDTDKMLTHISDALGYWIDAEASVSKMDGGPRSSYVA